MEGQLTHPPQPLIIVGEEFPNWRDVGRVRNRRTLIEVTTDAGWGQATWAGTSRASWRTGPPWSST